MTYQCPHCKNTLLYQPSCFQWWCQLCKLAFSKFQLEQQK